MSGTKCFCSISGRQLLPWVWGARLWIHGYIIHRQRPKNHEEKRKKQLRKNSYLTLVVKGLISFKTGTTKTESLPRLTWSSRIGYFLLTWSHYFLFTEAASSSFRTNFFLRASEISEAESSSLREVQPLLYLHHNTKTIKFMTTNLRTLRLSAHQHLLPVFAHLHAVHVLQDVHNISKTGGLW